MVSTILLLAMGLSGNEPVAAGGSIAGQVINASRHDVPVARAEVVLRMQLDGRFECVANTTSDDGGRFRFEDLPLGSEFTYLPGANRNGVHYPGSRLRLSRDAPRASTRLEVRDAVVSPNPLIARSHEIMVQPEPGALVVTETIEVENPTSDCYVGLSEREGQEPVTLSLAISPDFSRATFHQEFFGRRFAVVGDKLATSIPWQPGIRELKFTYILPNQQGRRKWKRPLDLPCCHVRLCVRGVKPEEVICNLQRLSGRHDGEAVFQSGDQALRAGHVIRLELGALPVPWAVYGRWLATAVLLGLVGIVGTVAVRDRRGRGKGKQVRPKANRC